MRDPLTIAVDAMGGDQAPRAVVAGANQARKRHPDCRFNFFGDETQVGPLINRFPDLAAVAEIIHTDDHVAADDKPSFALRRRPRSSMRVAIDAVADGRAAAMVSAGNTGALMAISKVVLKTLPGIGRPAIAGLMPTRRGECVFLDLGANLECSTDNLVDFAIMGALFGRTMLGIERPRVGLLNVGEEDLKGHEEIREAGAILRDTPLPFEFHGFVEGGDLLDGTTDVVVTDGFTGNVALKTAEGVSKLYSEFLRRALRETLFGRIGFFFARSAFRSLRERVDPRRHNGALFVGLNGIVVKSHGGTDALGFANAIDVAIESINEDFNSKIIDELKKLDRDGQQRRRNSIEM